MATDTPTEETIPVEELEAAIVAVGAGMRKLNSSRLKRRVVVLLIRDMTGQSIKNIEYVLNSLDQLEDRYLKKSKKKKS